MTASVNAHPSKNLCMKAIEEVSSRMGVSDDLMLKIAKVESGLGSTKTPWPWTIQVQGRSYYFKNKEAMVAYCKSLLRQGIENFDMGCFQINWRWHKDKVRSPRDLCDPRRNAFVAASFLNELKDRHQSWDQAVSYYHSGDPVLGAKYARLVFSQKTKKQGPKNAKNSEAS